MKLIVLNKTEATKADGEGVKGIPNFSPANTYRYNIDKGPIIRERLNLTPEQLLDRVVDRSEIQESDPDGD